MTRVFRSQAWAISPLAFALLMGLGGCTSGMLDQLPAAVGGEPAGLPQRPTSPYQYPAVHDMPPARANAPLDDNEQVRMEKELQVARDRQQSLYGSPPPATDNSAAKKKPAEVKSDQTSGASTNP